ncbi:hypothetical protein SAMN05444007_103383 [Cribrihabitans marinus]|uniref:Uncharacterized protein n=1 Tax=Cribrihabitans marinus TaxID=1227549 RepID=A0A1H6W6X0_9RHOB|nr:hypothetical protein [Cribrihabitans marinus]GGH24529.1 hypothetical protein GCM10010973_11090 [Cribrihabitans marinus]SEJ12729.1 hypothetical protein SAMN05444007_103383 [Cribrihabitans marinus]
MSRFLINPDHLSVFRADNEKRTHVSYCGVPVPGLDVSDDDAAWALECYLNELSGHERLALIGKFLDARHRKIG